MALWPKIILISTGVLLTAGGALYWLYFVRAGDSSKLVGKWELSGSEDVPLPKLEFSSATIELKRDGTVDAENLPVCLFPHIYDTESLTGVTTGSWFIAADVIAPRPYFIFQIGEESASVFGKVNLNGSLELQGSSCKVRFAKQSSVEIK